MQVYNIAISFSFPGRGRGKDSSSEAVQETSGPVQTTSGGRERTGTDT